MVGNDFTAVRLYDITFNSIHFETDDLEKKVPQNVVFGCQV